MVGLEMLVNSGSSQADLEPTWCLLISLAKFTQIASTHANAEFDVVLMVASTTSLLTNERSKAENKKTDVEYQT